MAGKMVRCKQCQSVFRVASPEDDRADVEGSNVDFDALAQSFGGEDVDVGTAGGPAVDSHGRASIRRRADVSDLSLSGDGPTNGRRSNLRYRYPFARQVDVGLPWLIVLLAIAVPLQLSLTTSDRWDRVVTGGVGFSRFLFLFLCTALIIFPLLHWAVNKAADELNFSLPRTPLWRSFACASSVLLIGGSLFILSRGQTVGLILGLIVGVATCVGLVTLLFRLMPHEVGTTMAYTGAAAGGGAIATALLLFGINYVGYRVVAAQEEPTLFASPIAVGLPWISEPVKPVDPPAPTPVAPTVTPATVADASTPPAPAGNAALQPLPLPPADSRGVQVLKSLEVTPVGIGFDEMIQPLVDAPAVGIIRRGGSGAVECWDASTWTLGRDRIGQNFDRAAGELAINTTADRVVRIISVPTPRIDTIPLGNEPPKPFIRLDGNNANRQLEGFVNDRELIVRQRADGNGIALERFNVADGAGALGEPQSLQVSVVATESTPAGNAAVAATPTGTAVVADKRNFALGGGERTLRFSPDGAGVIVAGTDPSNANKPTLAYYAMGNFDRPAERREVEWQLGGFNPLGLAINNAGRVALLLDASGEGYLTLWQVRERAVDGARLPPSKQAVYPRVGLMNAITPRAWQQSADPLCWIDDDTLLVYGQKLFDANSGVQIGELNVENVRNVRRLSDGKVLIVQSQNNITSLLIATFDVEGLRKARSGS